MSETVFLDGLVVKRPHENAPDFVKCCLAFKVEEMKAFLDKHNSDGWVNADIKVSKKGGLYAQLDSYKKKKKSDDWGDRPPINPPEDVETNNADTYGDIPF